MLLAATSLLALLLGFALLNDTPVSAVPIVTTDKPDYFSNETVIISGSGFAASQLLDVVVVRPDGSIVKGDGTLTPGWDTVQASTLGAFTYSYILNGIQGLYTVKVYANSDTAHTTVLASTTFMDADIDFNQCTNDMDNNNAPNGCDWTTGAINQNNSIYSEGDSVPHRLFHRLDQAGVHTMGFEYEFSKNSVYAYDFLTNVDQTQKTQDPPPEPTLPTPPGELLKPCDDLPGFVLPATCSSLFPSSGFPIPSDAYDAVSVREPVPVNGVAESGGACSNVFDDDGDTVPNDGCSEPPSARFIRVACVPACVSGSISVSFPSLNGGDDPGEAHLPDSDPDCFSPGPNVPSPPNPPTCGTSDVQIHLTFDTGASASTLVGVWLGGHLAQKDDPAPPISSPPDGWGTGCGTADDKDCGSTSVSGAPFHLSYVCLVEPSDSAAGKVCKDPSTAVGNRDNQIQPGAVVQDTADPKKVSLTVLGADCVSPPPTSITLSQNVTVCLRGQLHNNGPTTPVSVSDTLTAALPPDCTATIPSIPTQTLPMSTPVFVNTLVTIHCSQPSSHSFNFQNCIAILDNVIELNSGNNCASTSLTGVAVLASADVKITGQTITAPASANVSQNFTIQIDKTLHNNGPFGPVGVSITPTVAGPADCTVTPGVGNPASASLAVSVPSTLVTESFTVHCTQPSAHVFTINNCIAITTLHVSDPTPGNNCAAQVQKTVNLLAQADIKVPDVPITAPASANVGAAFSISATATLHNNGPFGPANVDTTLDITLPGDCTTSSSDPQTVQNTSVPVSAPGASVGPASWSITCTSPSMHTFCVQASAAVDQLHVSDPSAASLQKCKDVPVVAQADTKVTAVVVNAPNTVSANTPFNVDVTGTLHNNGPLSPVNADTTIDLVGAPAGCTVTPQGPSPQNLTLNQSVSQQVMRTFSVTCSSGTYVLTGTVTVTVDQLHVTDPVGNNNTKSGEDTVVVDGKAKLTVCKDVVPNDPSLWDFTLTGPTPGNRDDLGDGQCHTFNDLLPGSYTLTETAQGTYITSVDCGSKGSDTDNSITFTLNLGDAVTCTFVNTKPGGPPAVGGILGLLDEAEAGDHAARPAGPSPAGERLLAAAAALAVLGVIAGASYVWKLSLR